MPNIKPQSSFTVKKTNISAAKLLDRDDDAKPTLGKVGGGPYGGTSATGKLAGHLKKAVVRISSVEKRVGINERKITLLKNIVKLRKENVNKKLENEGLLDTVKSIAGSVDSIRETLIQRDKIAGEAAKSEKQKAEQERRDAKEKRKEKPKMMMGLQKMADKVLQPVKSLWSKIWDWIKAVIVGKVLVKMLNWFLDPKNEKKINSLIRFIGDWWPAIVGAVLIFGTGFGGLVTGLVGLIAGFIPALLGVVAKLSMIPGVGIALGAAGLLAAGWAIPKMFPGTVQTSTDKNVDESLQKQGPEATVKALEEEQAKKKDEGNWFTNFMRGTVMGEDAEYDKQIQRAKTGKEPGQGQEGGEVEGRSHKDGGVTLELEDGEVVMSNKAGDFWGRDFLLALNSIGGGSGGRAAEKAEEGGLVGPVDAVDDGRRHAKPADDSAQIGRGMGAKIIAGAKKVIGAKRGVRDMCANTTRMALAAAGHPSAKKRTLKGDLDTPKGTGFSGANFAASFGGSDMGKIITQKNQIEAGDIILWRADVNKGGNINKGAVTHVGIAADKGLKHQYDHNRKRGWHYRPHWDRAAGTSWFAGVRLGGSGGNIPEELDTSYGGGGTGTVNTGSSSTSTSTSTGGGDPIEAVDDGRKTAALTALTAAISPGSALLKMGLGGGGGGTNSLTEQAKTKTWQTYIGDGIYELFGKTPPRMMDTNRDDGKEINPDDYKLPWESFVKDIGDKGFIRDPAAALGLKSEGFENFVASTVGIKNIGAKINAAQMVTKSLLGPLGKMFRIDDQGSIGRYTKNAREFAAGKGITSIGADALGQTDYDRLLPDTIANLNLGQFHTEKDEQGRTITKDEWNANHSVEKYGKLRDKAWKEGNIGGAAFMQGSQILRFLEDKGWANLKPMGSSIVLEDPGKKSAQISKDQPAPPSAPEIKPPSTSTPKVTVMSADNNKGSTPDGSTKEEVDVPEISTGNNRSKEKVETMGIDIFGWFK